MPPQPHPPNQAPRWNTSGLPVMDPQNLYPMSALSARCWTGRQARGHVHRMCCACCMNPWTTPWQCRCAAPVLPWRPCRSWFCTVECPLPGPILPAQNQLSGVCWLSPLLALPSQVCGTSGFLVQSLRHTTPDGPHPPHPN